jgi:hypothetical protein
VSALAKRKLYLTASALILGAIAAQLLAKHHAGRGMMAMARAAAMPTERLRVHEAAAWHAHGSGLCDLASLGFAALAVGSFLASRRRREPGRQGVPIALGCLYVLLLLLIV